MGGSRLKWPLATLIEVQCAHDIQLTTTRGPVMTTTPQHPYHPIIYVRGFAATQGEIEETVADPYMGFNIGSTKSRVAWTGDVRRFYFESPLVRLMSDHKYEDVFVDGDDLIAADRAHHPVPSRTVASSSTATTTRPRRTLAMARARRPSSILRRGWES
ncbi:MAG: hypothetical protein ABIU05_11475 [Nitrospirales bacterium]